MTIPGTRRQTVQSAAGATLERAYLYMTPQSWQALLSLCRAFEKPASETIEQLIIQATSGKPQESDVNTTNRT